MSQGSEISSLTVFLSCLWRGFTALWWSCPSAPGALLHPPTVALQHHLTGSFIWHTQTHTHTSCFWPAGWCLKQDDILQFHQNSETNLLSFYFSGQFSCISSLLLVISVEKNCKVQEKVQFFRCSLSFLCRNWHWRAAASGSILKESFSAQWWKSFCRRPNVSPRATWRSSSSCWRSFRSLFPSARTSCSYPAGSDFSVFLEINLLKTFQHLSPLSSSSAVCPKTSRWSSCLTVRTLSWSSVCTRCRTSPWITGRARSAAYWSFPLICFVEEVTWMESNHIRGNFRGRAQWFLISLSCCVFSRKSAAAQPDLLEERRVPELVTRGLLPGGGSPGGAEPVQLRQDNCALVTKRWTINI